MAAPSEFDASAVRFSKRRRTATPKQFYLAGMWSDRDRLRHLVQQIEERYGWVCSHRWMDYTDRSQAQMSELDVNGVQAADVLLVIMDNPEYEYRGTFCEIGVALGSIGTRVCIYNPFERTSSMSCCFYHHPQIFHWKHLDAMLEFALNRQTTIRDAPPADPSSSIEPVPESAELVKMLPNGLRKGGAKGAP